MSLQKVAAFLDTNLFLHYRPLNEIDWCSILHADTVEIKIAPVVTRELEERKTLHQSRKIRDRAESALRLLHKYLGQSQVRDGVTLGFLIKELTAESAASRGLNLQLGDDRLIATLLLYREDNSDSRCVLITADLPLTVKANHYEIELLALSDTLRLPAELDETEKQLRQAQADLLKYQSREPVLDLQFDGGGKYVRFRLAPPLDAARDSEPKIQSMLKVARQKVAPVQLKPQQDPGAATVVNPFAEIATSIQKATEGFQAVGRQFYEDYNLRVEEYHRDYEKYLRDTFALETVEERTIRLEARTNPACKTGIDCHSWRLCNKGLFAVR